MTSRLQDLRRVRGNEGAVAIPVDALPDASADARDDDDDRGLREFEAEADRVARNLREAEEAARELTAAAKGDGSAATATAAAGLATVEARLRAARRGLAALGKANHQAAAAAVGSPNAAPASLKVRLTGVTRLRGELLRVAGAAEQAAQSVLTKVNRAPLHSDVTSATDAKIFEVHVPRPPPAVLQHTQNSADARTHLDMLHARNEDVAHIARGVAELQELFTELAELVDRQHDLINHVEADIDSAKAHHANADEQLAKALDRMRRARRMKIRCFSGLAVIIVVAVLALILFLVLR